MNSVLKNLLTIWFSTGLLNIQRIDWKSPTVLGIQKFFLNLFSKSLLEGFYGTKKP